MEEKERRRKRELEAENCIQERLRKGQNSGIKAEGAIGANVLETVSTRYSANVFVKHHSRNPWQSLKAFTNEFERVQQRKQIIIDSRLFLTIGTKFCNNENVQK